MAVIFPCGQCEGHGHTVAPSGQHEDCPRCNGRGWLESTEMRPTDYDFLRAVRHTGASAPKDDRTPRETPS